MSALKILDIYFDVFNIRSIKMILKEGGNISGNTVSIDSKIYDFNTRGARKHEFGFVYNALSGDHFMPEYIGDFKVEKNEYENLTEVKIIGGHTIYAEVTVKDSRVEIIPLVSVAYKEFIPNLTYRDTFKDEIKKADYIIEDLFSKIYDIRKAVFSD